MKTIKKASYKLLCNTLTGYIIVLLFKEKIPDIRWKGYRFTFKGGCIPPEVIASVFWGFYESAEIRFAEKYFKGNMDVIEMGGSCGVVTAHLVSKLQPGRKLIAIEANKNLAAIWKENTKRNNVNQADLLLLNNAIYYEGDSVAFHISSNTTESRNVEEDRQNANNVQVPAITLHEITSTCKLREYALICDIEGAEAAVFVNEKTALDLCRIVMIELHPVIYRGVSYTNEMLEALILSKGFTLKDKYGPVYYFEK